MTKCWCIWCESGNEQNNPKYFWIHPECAQKLMSISGDVKSIKEMLQGIHPRNKDEESKILTIYDFIKDMELFENQWKGTMKIIEKMKEQTAKSKDERSKK